MPVIALKLLLCSVLRRVTASRAKAEAAAADQSTVKRSTRKKSKQQQQQKEQEEEETVNLAEEAGTTTSKGVQVGQFELSSVKYFYQGISLFN